MVRTGCKHEKMLPMMSIFPMCGSTGRRDRCCPSAVSSPSSSTALTSASVCMATLTADSLGGSSAEPRKELTSLYPMERICRQSSSSGTRRISGVLCSSR
eukprot:751785-Hanusia_phi.AAC.5